MPKPRQSANPFYALLLVVGITFALTACAYFVMALRGANPGPPLPAHGLMALLENHGLLILMSELGLLSVATLGAMLTDEYWMRRATRQTFPRDLSPEPNHESESLRGD